MTKILISPKLPIKTTQYPNFIHKYSFEIRTQNLRKNARITLHIPHMTIPLNQTPLDTKKMIKNPGNKVKGKNRTKTERTGRKKEFAKKWNSAIKVSTAKSCLSSFMEVRKQCLKRQFQRYPIAGYLRLQSPSTSASTW